MVLVGMGEDDEVDAAVPGRDAGVELEQETVRVRAAVDEEAAALAVIHISEPTRRS